MWRDVRWLAGLVLFPLRLWRPLEGLCLLAALVIVPSFWSEATAERGDPELLALSRMELSYFVALSQLASELPPATVSPAVAAEHGRICPTLPLLPHAVAWRWAGLPGLIAADVLVTLLGYCLWCALFRLLTGHAGAALLGAAATVNGTAVWLMQTLHAGCSSLYYAGPHLTKALLLAVAGGAIAAALWQAHRRAAPRPWWRAVLVGILAAWIVSLEFDPDFAGIRLFRFPRPFVTTLITNLWLLALMMTWRQPRRRLPDALIGLMAGLEVQSDIFSFVSLALATLGVWSVRKKMSLRFAAAVLLPFAAVAAPFAVKQLALPPEMRLRLGLTPLPRAAVWQITRDVTGPYGPLALVLLAVLAVCLLRQARPRRHPLQVMALLALATAAAPAFLAGVVGEAAQFSHYFFLVPEAFTLFAWAALTTTAASLPLPSPAPLAHRLGWALALACGIAGGLLPKREPSVFGGLTFFPRAELVTLVRELRRPRYAACRVLGTWQPEVRAWWMAFRGPALNPDPFVTNLPEPELERRVLELARLQEMSPEQFAALLGRTGEIPTAFWQFGHFKYHVWRWHTLAPWSDYSRPETDEGNDFLFPDSTLARIATRYPEGAAVLPCDLIVRERPATDAEHAPHGYALTYSGPHYQVLQREPVAP